MTSQTSHLAPFEPIEEPGIYGIRSTITTGRGTTMVVEVIRQDVSRWLVFLVGEKRTQPFPYRQMTFHQALMAARECAQIASEIRTATLVA